MSVDWNMVAVIVALALYGYLAWMMCRRQIRAGLRRVRDLPRGVQALFAVVAIVATVEAQKAGTNDTNNASGGTNMMMSAGRLFGDAASSRVINQEMTRQDAASPRLRTSLPSPYTLTTNDVLRGFAVVSQIALSAITLPSNAVIVGNWDKHGVASMWGAHKTDFPGFDFPFGPDGILSDSTWYFPDGKIRAELRNEDTEIDTGIGAMIGIPGESMLARSTGDDGSESLWWYNFHDAYDTNTTITAVITLRPDGSFALVNTNTVTECVPARPGTWLSIYGPTVIMRNGPTNTVTAYLSSPFSLEVTPEINCVQGSDKLEINRIDQQTLEFIGTVGSDEIDDIVFEATATVCGETYVVTQAMTVAYVTNLWASTIVEETSTNPPPFAGEMEWPFCITNSLAPDKHLVVPFCNVATQTTNGFDIADFTVYMGLDLAPAGVYPAGLEGEWEVIESIPEMSGTFVGTSSTTAEFRNPKQGGVYRFRGRIGECPWTECNVVLPLAGASVDTVVAEDLAKANIAITSILASTTKAERNDSTWGKDMFYNDGMGDYSGRVNNLDWPTVWLYNQMSESAKKFGLGVVGTWHNYPVRMSKISNFFVSYATAKLGINGGLLWIARIRHGTWDDATASLSWNAGSALAAGGNAYTISSALPLEMWPVSDMKERTLWPNPEPTDNHVPKSFYNRLNFMFTSPGFIEVYGGDDEE